MVIIRILILFTLLASLSACRLSGPLRTIMQGDMTMDGGMTMDGDMSMDGDMNMSGQIATTMRSDNLASRLVSVPVYGNPECTPSVSGRTGTPCGPALGKIAVLDIDGLLVNKKHRWLRLSGRKSSRPFSRKLDAIAGDPSITAIVRHQ
ncbi:MAG: hypothetical protein R3C56_37505 [Pirellulaceae bacterium]